MINHENLLVTALDTKQCFVVWQRYSVALGRWIAIKIFALHPFQASTTTSENLIALSKVAHSRHHFKQNYNDDDDNHVEVAAPFVAYLDRRME